ncbi:MAG: zf-HC2 domain-containing protein [Thermodesulfobacteriota bacterium]
MECKECSELLLEYLSGELSQEQKDSIKDHLSSCSDECLKEFEELTLIKMAANNQALPEVSSQTLQNISKEASVKTNLGQKTFWNKWGFRPILVPALTTAIALSVWFYYGYDAANIGPEISTIKTPVQANEPAGGQTTFSDENVQMEGAVLRQEEQLYAEDNILEHSIESDARNLQPIPPPPPAVPAPMESKELELNPELEQVKKKQLPKNEKSQVMAKNKSEVSPQSNVQSDLSNQDLELREKGEAIIASQKNKTNCDLSIRTNEAFLNSNMPQSKSSQQKSYKELAECYEEQGEFDKAITNYMNLQQVAPEESYFANTRIQAIQDKIELDRLKKEESSNSVPSN